MSWKVSFTASSASLLDVVASSHTMTMHQRLSFLRFASLVVSNNAARRFSIAVVAMHGRLYTFSIKQNGGRSLFWFFTARSSAEAYLYTSPGHSTVGFQRAVKVSWRFG